MCEDKPYPARYGFRAGVTVIWASSRFGHPHSQKASPVTLTLTLTQIAK